jgi:putative glycosyl hydrolase-like family 15 (GHL15) protein
MAYRTQRAGIVVVALLAAIVLSAVPAGADVGSFARYAPTRLDRGPGHVPVWAADFMAGAVTVSRERALRQARDFDMIVALKGTYAEHADAMRSANPDLTLLVYLNGVMAQSNEGSAYPDSWYATDARGARVRSLGFGNFLMRPDQPRWVDDVASRCTDYLRESGYDGCFIDVLGIAPLSPAYVTGVPVDPSTGKVWTPAAWLRATRHIAEETRRLSGRALVYGNGLADGSRYFADVPSSSLLRGLDGAMAESFVRDATAPIQEFRHHDSWRLDVRMLADAAARGSDALSMTKVWTTATARQRTALQRYALGTFLLGYQPGHGMFSFRDDHGLTRYRPIWSVDLGVPLGAARAVDGAFVRRFENGIVVVNPTAARIHVGIGSRVYARGRFSGNVSVGAHSASILTTR